MTNPDTALQPIWRDVLAASYRALADTVAAVRPEQRHLATPCAEWTVAQVVEHAAGDQLAYAAALGVGAGPGYDPFAPTGVEFDPDALVRDAIEQSAAAWATVPDTAPTVPTPLPQGELATPIAGVLCALDAAVHAWDIAVAIGVASPLDDQLAGHLLTGAREVVEPLRQWGAYAPVVASAPGDTAADDLLRYLGRNPR